MIAASAERCTENDEGDRRGRRCNLRDGFEDRCRDRQLHKVTQCPCNRAEYHGIHEYAAQNRQKVETSAAKGLKHKHAKYIVERNNDSDHHGWDRNRRIPKDISDERNAHEDVVAAKGRLYHRAAPRVIRLNAADDDSEDESREEHSARAEDHEHRLKRCPRIRNIDVIEHHEEEEHTEHHAVHMHEFFLGQEM